MITTGLLVLAIGYAIYTKKQINKTTRLWKLK